MSTRQFAGLIVAGLLMIAALGVALGWFVSNKLETQTLTIQKTIQETSKDVITKVNNSTNERAGKTDDLLRGLFSDQTKTFKDEIEQKTSIVTSMLTDHDKYTAEYLVSLDEDFSAHDNSVAMALASLNKDHAKLVLIQNELLLQGKQHDRISEDMQKLDMKADRSLTLLAENSQKLKESGLKIADLQAQTAEIKGQQAELDDNVAANYAGLTELRGEVDELIKKIDVLLVVHGLQESDIKVILAALDDLNERLAKIDGMVSTLGQLQNTIINVQNTVTLTEQHVTNLTQNITNITNNIEKVHSVVITNIKLMCKSIKESDKPKPSECPSPD